MDQVGNPGLDVVDDAGDHERVGDEWVRAQEFDVEGDGSSRVTDAAFRHEFRADAEVSGEEFAVVATGQPARSAVGVDAALVQSEHLLLALVDPPRDSVGRALAEAGITADRIVEARNREFRSALAAVGVDTERPTPPPSSRLRRGRTTRFAPSAKLALERTLRVCVELGDRRISNRHLLAAIAGAEAGATPALLAELGTTAEEMHRLAASA